MSDLPIPKFKLGDKVFRANLEQASMSHPCPDCLGTRVWKIITPAGTELEADCGRCTSRWVGGPRDLPSLGYLEWTCGVRELTIGSIEAKTRDYDGVPSVRYMCLETGVGSGTIYNESDLFVSSADAEASGMAVAAIKNAEKRETPEAIRTQKLSNFTLRDAAFKDSDSRIWSAWYAYRRLKEDIEDWAKETTLKDDADQALRDLLKWENDHRESPTPELLDALQTLLDTMSITDEEGLLEFAEPVAKARAAIFKATSSSEAALIAPGNV